MPRCTAHIPRLSDLLGNELAIARKGHQRWKIFLWLSQSFMYPAAVNSDEISFSVTKQIPKTYFRLL